jgi:hypothetical protein
MKTRILLIIVGVAIFTLSFVTISKDKATSKQSSKANQSEEPIGGFVSQDAL